MKGLIIAAALMGASALPASAQIQTCVWPNRCASVSQRVTLLQWLAQVQPCVWPRICRWDRAA